MITEKEIMQVLSKAMHPEIDYSLAELGMIKKVNVERNNVEVTINLPFQGIPIKDDLARIVIDTITDANQSLQVKIEFATMNEKERKEFMSKAQEKWKL